MNEAANPDLLLHLDLLKEFDSIYVGVLTMGLFYGLTLCSFSCLPLIGPYVFGTQSGIRQGLSATVVFVSSKVMTYGFLGVASGVVGAVLLEMVDPSIVLAGSGAVIVAVGVLAWRRRGAACSTPSGTNTSTGEVSRWRTYRHMASVGAATSLMPCLPLSAVLLYAATTQSPVTGGTLALLFGLGTAVSPLYYLGGGAAGWFSKKIQRIIPQHRNVLSKLSSVIVILMGAKLLVMSGMGLTDYRW